MLVSTQQQLVCLFIFLNATKFMILIMFERRDKTCSNVEKTWFLLVHQVERNSKTNEKAVVKWCSVKKEFKKFRQIHLRTSAFFNRATGQSGKFCEILKDNYSVKHFRTAPFEKSCLFEFNIPCPNAPVVIQLCTGD